MNRQKNHLNQITKAALISMLIVIAGVSSTASAGSDRDGYRRGEHRSGHRYNDSYRYGHRPEYAGRITIDGYSTSIRSDRPMNRQIVRAFRNRGYDARIHDGRIVIDYGYCQPTVRWSTDRYKARFHWDSSYNELTISLKRYSRHSSVHRRRSPNGVGRRSIWRGHHD
ncbi:MAG: hypothetical protein JKX70_03695 [Phycisphaerales bacterium]|nr:hypothetical protein [Phycisphaerales bacterium]